LNQQRIDQLVKEFSGIPYLHGGRTMEGLDCIGLVWLFYQKYGIKIQDSDGKVYEPDWYRRDPDRFLRGLQTQGAPVSLSQLQPLDLVYFKIGGSVTHAAVMIDPHHFLHVMIREVVHVTRLNPSWRRRLAGARRFSKQ
jgi:cell wall-associated NlpC family hydrolase